MPLEESGDVLRVCDERGVALVPLVAPSTPEARLQRIGECARGFVYTVSLMGTTGERSQLADALPGLLDRARRNAAVPIAVGFGIATAGHARAAAEAGADGVIVGSRLVRAAQEAEDPPAAVRAVVDELARALADGAAVESESTPVE
jgi:tryptophan synthase alpha chain